MVKRGWDAHVLGKAPHQFKDALTAVKTLRVRAGGAGRLFRLIGPGSRNVQQTLHCKLNSDPSANPLTDRNRPPTANRPPG
jgi:hypothetical protein